jgi:hypothetical protein
LTISSWIGLATWLKNIYSIFLGLDLNFVFANIPRYGEVGMWDHLEFLFGPIKEPGQALDIGSSTAKILEVLHSIRDGGRFNIRIIDETGTASPHYHVTVNSSNI